MSEKVACRVVMVSPKLASKNKIWADWQADWEVTRLADGVKCKTCKVKTYSGKDKTLSHLLKAWWEHMTLLDTVGCWRQRLSVCLSVCEQALGEILHEISRKRQKNVAGKAVPPGGAIPVGAGRSSVPTQRLAHKVRRHSQVHLAVTLPLPVLHVKSQVCSVIEVMLTASKSSFDDRNLRRYWIWWK